MKIILMTITKVYFSTPYIFLIYKILSKNNFNLFKVILLILFAGSLYNIFNNKKWIYKLTIIIATYFVIITIPFTFLTSIEKEYIGIYSNLYSDILSLLFLIGLIILYFFNQKLIIIEKIGDR